MRTVFIDANYLIALETGTDQHHHAAAQHWKDAESEVSLRLITTSYVFDEVVTFLNRRGRHDRAVEIGKRLLSSNVIRVLDVHRPVFDAGWAYFQQHSDKRYSLTDSISFVIMQRMKISIAFTFDHHFRQVGFTTEP